MIKYNVGLIQYELSGNFRILGVPGTEHRYFGNISSLIGVGGNGHQLSSFASILLYAFSL